MIEFSDPLFGTSQFIPELTITFLQPTLFQKKKLQVENKILQTEKVSLKLS